MTRLGHLSRQSIFPISAHPRQRRTCHRNRTVGLSLVYDNLMAIFNADLTPDSSFCPGGLCNLALIATNYPARKPTIANDGKIIVLMTKIPSHGICRTEASTRVSEPQELFQLGTTDYFRDVEVDDAGRVLVGMSSLNPSSSRSGLSRLTDRAQLS